MKDIQIEWMSDEQNPVAWMMINNTFDMSPSLHWTLQKWHASWKPIPLYIHPAPDVVKQLVEAAEAALDLKIISIWAENGSTEKDFDDIAKLASETIKHGDMLL